MPPALVLALIRVESSGYNFAKSNKGAIGLMQLLPTTAAWVAEKIGDPWDGADSLYEADTNVRLGIAYLSQLLDRYDGSVPRALAAYNWGPGRISGFIHAGKAVPTTYADRVLASRNIRHRPRIGPNLLRFPMRSQALRSSTLHGFLNL